MLHAYRILFILLVGSIFSYGQIGGNSGDPKIKKQLTDDLEYTYTLTSSGDYSITCTIDDDRTQAVFINSNTQQYKNFDIREVWSIAYISDGPLSARAANYLLNENGRKKLGGWATTTLDDDKVLIYFTVQIASNSNADDLNTAIWLCAYAADEGEEYFHTNDKY